MRDDALDRLAGRTRNAGIVAGRLRDGAIEVTVHGRADAGWAYEVGSVTRVFGSTRRSRRRVGSESAALLWHNGGTGGSAAFAALEPERRTAIVLLANAAIAGPLTGTGLGLLAADHA